MQGIPHLRMRRLNPSQAGSCGVMSTSASPLRRCAVLGRTGALGSFPDSCGNTTPTERQRRRRDNSTRQRRVLRKLARLCCWPTAHGPKAVGRGIAKLPDGALGLAGRGLLRQRKRHEVDKRPDSRCQLMPLWIDRVNVGVRRVVLR